MILKWTRKLDGMLFFTGNPGCGKTHLCAAILNYLYGKVSSIRYWTERSFLAKARDSIDQQGDYIENMKYYADDYVMILDDLGSCGFTDWRKEVFQSLIDYRTMNMLPTVVTTNLTKNELQQMFHSRFNSRIFSKENYIIDFDGPDFRKNPELLEKNDTTRKN